MDSKQTIQNRAYLIALPFVVMALAVLVKLFVIQYGEGPALREQSQREVIREMSIPAERGNIFSADNQLLATSMPVYDIYFDPLSVKETAFSTGLPSLAKQLAGLLDQRSAPEWRQYLTNERARGNRYVHIAEDLRYSELQKLKQFAIFNRGKYAGGLIYEQENFRKMPLGKIGERTIGRDRRYLATGLEGAYSQVLSGQEGKRLKQKVSNGNWKPVTNHFEIEPEDGQDIRSTIHTRMQDVVHHELLRALEQYEADHGCAVLMDVKTGAIRGIANLGRTEEGTYFEKRNYAVWESTEPGSTFKLAAVMAALEDGYADTNTIIDTQNGYYSIYGTEIRDSYSAGHGKVSLKRAFELSSNVGIVKLMQENYGHAPGQFIDRLYTIGLQNKLGLPIKGEGKPHIPKPGDPDWSGLSLPWASFGYQVSFTPLQLLSFYNAVANDGVMVKPRFLEDIRQHGRVLKKSEPEILNPMICSQETLAKLQDLLQGVVKQGTAANIRSKLLPLAGKTGTCKLNYWKADQEPEYQASFAGYFPADNPQYSCIVVINKPNSEKGYYGSVVAAPVFKAIAENIYSSTPQPLEQRENTLAQHKSWREKSSLEQKLELGSPLPDLTGHSGAEVISTLENMGISVKASGTGKVLWHYPPSGRSIDRKTLVELKLG